MTFSACRSNWICVNAWLAAVLAAPVAAQAPVILVRPADRADIATDARQVVATTFLVSNRAATALEVESRLSLPSGWMPVTPPTLFTLAAGEELPRLASFTVPEDAHAGEYSVTYEVRDRLNPANVAAWSLPVLVRSSVRVQLQVLDLPDQAVSGDVIAAALWFRNAGNSPVQLSYVIGGRFIAQATPQRGHLALRPAESRRVDVALTLEEVRQRAVGRLSVEVTADGAVIDRSNGAAFPIVPRAHFFDALRTLSSRAEARFVAREAPGASSAGWQPVLTGSGALFENRADQLSFQLRGPDRRQSGSFGASEEYWVQYRNADFSAGAGDLTYALSPLTEPGRLGRGAMVALRREKWGVTAYGMNDLFGQGDADQVGLGAQFSPDATTELGLQVLERASTRDGRLWTLRARSRWNPQDSLDFEFGRSDADGVKGGALRFAWRAERGAVRYHALGWFAEPTFLGPLRDRMYFYGGFDAANPGGWGLRGYYRMQDWNLLPLEAIDPDLHGRLPLDDRMKPAPRERQASLGTGRTLGSGTSLSFDVVRRDRSADSEARGGPRESWSLRAAAAQSWRDVSLQLSEERGLAVEQPSGQRSVTFTRLLSGTWRANPATTVGAYWMRDENSALDARAPRREALGLNLGFSRGGFKLSLDTQRTQSAFGRSGIHELSLRHETRQGARWTLAARRIEGRFSRTDLLASYSLPFALPVMPRRDVTPLRGLVIDAETSRGIRDVVLRLDGVAAVTNGRGEFEFPAVRPGAHQVFLERGPRDVRQVPTTPMPLAVNVTEGARPPLHIRMTRSVAITVSVVTLDERGMSSPAPGVLVHFRQGELLYRRVSDAAGQARLAGIPPGEWRIGAAPDTVPPGHRAPADEEVLECAAGETPRTELVLRRERREMRMLPPLAVR